MRIETALKRRDRGVDNLRGLYSSAACFGYLSADMERRRQELLAIVCARAPQWVRSFLDGYWRALIEGAYSRDLVFGGFDGAKFYSTHRDRADYYERNGMNPCDYADDGRITARGHYWRNSVDNGAPKPFFVDQAVRS